MLESLFLLIPVSIFFVLLIGVALWWAIFSGQFDDLDAASKSILLDDDRTDAEQPVSPVEGKQHSTQQNVKQKAGEPIRKSAQKAESNAEAQVDSGAGGQ